MSRFKKMHVDISQKTGQRQKNFFLTRTKQMTGATTSWSAASGRPGWKRPRRRRGFCALPLTQQLVHRIFMIIPNTQADTSPQFYVREVGTRLETFSSRPPLTDLPTPARFSLNRLHGPDDGLRFLLSRCSVNTSRASRPHRSASSPDCFTALPVALKCFCCREKAEME